MLCVVDIQIEDTKNEDHCGKISGPHHHLSLISRERELSVYSKQSDYRTGTYLMYVLNVSRGILTNYNIIHS
jgi:hypothetical protein